MTLILENTNQLEYHTNVYEIIEPFKGEFSNLNWLLTNQDYTLLDYDEKGVVEKLDHNVDRIVFSGTELLEILETREIDFFWCVFSGFRGEIPKLKKHELPFADMNKSLWEKPDSFLTEKAEMEIISFDGSLTLFKTKNKEIEDKFKAKFTDAKKLKKTLPNKK